MNDFLGTVLTESCIEYWKTHNIQEANQIKFLFSELY